MEEIIKDVKTLELLKEEIRIVVENNRSVKSRIEKLKKLGYKILVKENFKGCSYKTSRSCWEYGTDFDECEYDDELGVIDIRNGNLHYTQFDYVGYISNKRPSELSWCYQISSCCRQFKGLEDSVCVFYVEVTESEFKKRRRKLKIAKINSL